MKNDFRDWSDVRVFLAVARAGSTLAACRDLGMAQPTVARRIEALEQALGLVLFRRDTRGFHPTPEGGALMAEAEAMERAAAGLALTADRLRAGHARTIRITSFSDAFIGRMPQVLQAFTERHPGVQFELLSSNAPLNIAAGEADVAIRVAQTVDDPTLICRKIRDIRMCLFASKTYAARHGLPTSQAELAGHRFILYRGRLAEFAAQRWVRARIDPTQIVMEADDLNAAQGAVMIGKGIGVFALRYAQEQPSFATCFELPAETALGMWLLINPAAFQRPEVKAFARFFVPRYRGLFSDSLVAGGGPERPMAQSPAPRIGER